MKNFILPFLLIVVPSVAFAAPGDNVFSLMKYVGSVIYYLQVFFWTLAMVLFVYGLVKFMMHTGDVEERENGKQYMIWGVIALVVLVSLWALVGLVLNSLGISPTATPSYVDKNGA